jgi:hypothetical protein
MDVNAQFHASAALPTTKEFRYKLNRDWGDPRFGLDVAEKKKKVCPFGESNSDSSVVQFMA